VAAKVAREDRAQGRAERIALPTRLRYEPRGLRRDAHRLGQCSGMTPEGGHLDGGSGATDNGAMTLHVLRLPISLDPLIAEAKRRARQRRLLLAALGVVVAAGAVIGVTLASRGSDRPRTAIVGTPGCHASQLHLSWRSAGVAGGSAFEAFTFRNTSSSACSLHGWPSFRFVMHDGRTVVPHPHDLIATAYRVTHPPSIPRVVLQPSDTALLSVFEADGTGYQHACQLTRTVLVTLPSARAPLSVSAKLFYCGPRDMWVLPVGRRN
jgi:hypothetical protein